MTESERGNAPIGNTGHRLWVCPSLHDHRVEAGFG